MILSSSLSHEEQKTHPGKQHDVLSFLTEERACHMLLTHGYTPVVRFHHLHARKEYDVRCGKQREDERHICLLDELSSLSPSTFFTMINEAFEEDAHRTFMQ